MFLCEKNNAFSPICSNFFPDHWNPIITLAPACILYTVWYKQWCTLGGARGCSIFLEINVKRRSNPPPLKVLNILQCTAHTVFRPAKLFHRIMISKSVQHICTTASVVRVEKENPHIYSAKRKEKIKKTTNSYHPKALWVTGLGTPFFSIRTFRSFPF